MGYVCLYDNFPDPFCHCDMPCDDNLIMAEDKNKFLVKSSVTSLLPCPEHHIRRDRGTPSTDAIPARNTLPFLELDIIRRDNIGKEPLDFIDRKESSGIDGN
jgi:hypothetical protein